jgi:hypothetical protein
MKARLLERASTIRVREYSGASVITADGAAKPSRARKEIAS